MPEQLFANVASTTITAEITAVQSVFSVTSSANFPAANTTLEQEFRAAFVDTATPPNILEYIAVTNVSGTSWTVTRAAEDATRFPAAIRGVGTRVVMLVTRGVLESFERRSRTVGHNVLDYGAVGNSHHNTGGGADDTIALQDAIDDSRGGGGQSIVVFPGRRTYRITSSLTNTTGTEAAVQVIGLGSMNSAGQPDLPTVVWDGVQDGTMMNIGTTGTNIFGALVRNINFRGQGAVSDDMTDLPGTLFRFFRETAGTAKIDSGSGLDEVWMARCRGDAVRVEGGGLTNWWIRGGRWDQINGYAVYVKITSQSIMSVRDVTYDSWGSAFPGHGKGMFHFDAAAGGNTAVLFVHLDTVHPEVNSDPIEINPSGTDPADRTGWIGCTIDPAAGVVSHNITLTNITLQGGSTKSRSGICMMGGTTDERKARLNLNGRNMRGFFGDGTAATGHIIPIGGIPTADKSPYTGGVYNQIQFAPGGATIFGAETPRAWTRVTA
jgi:hypothetical protein